MSKTILVFSPGRQYFNNIKKALDKPHSAPSFIVEWEAALENGLCKAGIFSFIPGLEM